MFPKVALFEACWSDFVKVSIPGPPESETKGNRVCISASSEFLQEPSSMHSAGGMHLGGGGTRGRKRNSVSICYLKIREYVLPVFNTQIGGQGAPSVNRAPPHRCPGGLGGLLSA